MNRKVNYIIFDLEATCDEERLIKNEIIEIGAVKINSSGEIIDTFDKFVKPVINPVLTEFCKNLTSITQEQVDTAEGFKQVCEEFKNWIGESDYWLCSWGFYDKLQFTHDCNFHNLDFSWGEKHISLKHQYQTIRNQKKGVGVSKALRANNLTFEGTQHRGIDDALNILKIFLMYFDKWEFK
ncbi:MAG: 3-5 exonuclease [Clostridiaceae bacterium]|nr:3-5 exonuclease [Clostridiaceae bacterium]